MVCPNCGYCPHCGRSGHRWPCVPARPLPWEYRRPLDWPCEPRPFGMTAREAARAAIR